MKYRLVYTKTSAKDIKKFDRVVKKRIGVKIKEYSEDPLKRAKKLTNFKLGQYRWRIGNHRVIFDIVDRDIVILRIRHRKESYR